MSTNREIPHDVWNDAVKHQNKVKEVYAHKSGPYWQDVIDAYIAGRMVERESVQQQTEKSLLKS